MPNKKLSLWIAILININIVIGGGFFLGIPRVLHTSGLLAPLSWSLVGILILPLILIIAKFSTIFPEAGGIFVYSDKVLGSFLGFLCGWGYFIGTAAGNAAILDAFGKQVQLFGFEIPWITPLALNISLILFFTLINLKNIDFLERFKANIFLTQNLDELSLLLPPQKKKAKKEPPKPYEVFWIEGQKVLLGKNKRGNIELLKIARAGDIWMHIQGMPSTHVIIQTSKQNVSDKLLYAAAKLCVDFSTTKIGRFLVDYTHRREVKVQSEANVLYNKYQTLSIDKAH